MKNIYLLLSLLTIQVAFSQNYITVSMRNMQSGLLEDVIASNLTTNDFYYSDKDGNLKLIFKSETDKFRISLPSYEDKLLTVAEITALNKIVTLKEKAIKLDEVLIVSNSKKSSISYKLKAKKKYFFNFTSPGGSVVSPYEHKKSKSDTLSSISFFFNHEKILADSDIKIRLLIFKDDNKWIPLVEYPTSFYIDNEKDELNISFKNSKIIFKENEKYLIGFELLNKEKANTVDVLSTSIKNTISYFKPSPNQNWFRIESEKPTFSLYYEIYFKN
jgi:hypothetical protein